MPQIPMYVVGGQQKYLRPFFADDSNWYDYHKGIILRLDGSSGDSEALVEYTSPAEVGVTTLFKSASLVGNFLYICTQTEVLVYALPDFRQVHYVSLPCFNDVHHVTPTPWGSLAVAVAGLDLVQEVTLNGEMLRTWDVLGQDAWSKFSKSTDYRQINTKPHNSHPNFVFFLDDEIWATRFCQKDAISLEHPERRIDIAVASPHDGLVHGDYVYFTTVNGTLVIANRKTLVVEARIDLNQLHDYGAPLGWCRGVLVQDEKVWIGFSRIRPTKLRENVEWLKRSVKSTIHPVLPGKFRSNSRWLTSKVKRELPTHIACYDLANNRCIQEINIEPHGISAVFGMYEAQSAAARQQRPARPATVQAETA